MARFKCNICGFIYDEEKGGVPLKELDGCPVCKQPISMFTEVKEDLRDLVSQLRLASDGRPIGIKIAAGKIEKDLEYTNIPHA